MTTRKRADLSRYKGHTPGPWTVTDKPMSAISAGEKSVAVVGLYDSPMPERRVVGQEHKANARLIADAPDLLREVMVLREALKVLARRVPVAVADEERCISEAIEKAAREVTR